ncbi:MAG: aspartate dehydrogenase [Methanosarcinaceae archaeon]|nr:aspartate dehydrogenase [Methanosarcinaceae archaeon]NKQ38100.1 aspartate dehydrogenase [Methanosarcinales archaeon]
MLKVGIIGCGAIGTEISKAIDGLDLTNINLCAIYDRSYDDCLTLLNKLKLIKPRILEVREMVKEVDFIIECASIGAVYEVIPDALNADCDVMILSIGALQNTEFLNKISNLAIKRNCKIYLPSGAIAGIDGLKSASSGEINYVTLITEKPPSGLKGAPFIIENNIDLNNITKRTVLFEGTAFNAIKSFPANVNISAIISLVGIGFEKTRVTVIANPMIKENMHTLTVFGDFGKFTTKIENVPSPLNPKTSRMSAMSAIALLKNITNPFQIGT